MTGFFNMLRCKKLSLGPCRGRASWQHGGVGSMVFSEVWGKVFWPMSCLCALTRQPCLTPWYLPLAPSPIG